MNNDKKIYIIEQLIQESKEDLSVLLETDTFMKYVRVADAIAIEFISNHVHELLQILFVNFENISNHQYQIYSDLISRVWEIIDLNIEVILLQIENYWEILFDLRGHTNVPDVQWTQAHKLLILVKQRQENIIHRTLCTREQLLISLIPSLYCYSAVQIILSFFEHGFHEQQMEFLKIGVGLFPEFDPCTAINFTFLIHEIMTRIATKELMHFLLSNYMISATTQWIGRRDLHFIVRKNAAHIVSLISNHYSLDMQNLYLDEPYSEAITTAFRKTEFYQTFDISVISDVLETVLQRESRIGLLCIKLVEIVDNLVRITDLELWEKVAQSNIMGIIFQMAKKFHKSDIFNSYVNNMLIFILDRAISDFHPYWAVQLMTNNKLQNTQLLSIDRQIFVFEQQLSVKLIRDSDFLPYYDELKIIENSLKTSTIWRRTKSLLQEHDQKHTHRLGEDPELPPAEKDFIISAIYEDKIDEIIEPETNIFIDCIPRNKPSPFDSLKNNDPDSDEDQEVIPFATTGLLDKLKNVFQQMDLQEEQAEQAVERGGKKFRNLSSSLNNEIHKEKSNFLSRSLKNDQEQLSKLSLSSSTNVKRLNMSFEEFKVEIFQNRKVLKTENDNVLKVDEIDFQFNKDGNY